MEKNPLTKAEVKVARELINKALASVGKTMEMNIKVGNISYGTDYFSAKVEAVRIGGETREARAYKDIFKMLNLPPLGTEIVLRNEKFKITGWNSRARKAPVMMDRTKDGRAFKTSEDVVGGIWKTMQNKKSVKIKRKAGACR